MVDPPKMNFLQYLLNPTGRAVLKSELLDQVCGISIPVCTRKVDVTITILR
mgnify:FL=1